MSNEIKKKDVNNNKTISYCFLWVKITFQITDFRLNVNMELFRLLEYSSRTRKMFA